MHGPNVNREQIEPGVIRGQWWHRLDDGRIQCDLCPRECKLHDGQRGFCFVREARDGGVVLTSYGRATGYCIDPIEKKPLNHFYPGSSVLSFGTAGCNLGCRFCQNWDSSKARDDRVMSAHATPAMIADAAIAHHCRSVAFTYNDPTIFAEYAIDTAIAAHERGLHTVVVSSGYIGADARRDFYAHIDAANIDLESFSEEFYHQVCFAHLQPVLDTLLYLHRETDVWLEVTTLLIPGRNDSEDEVERLCQWFAANLGPDVPLHLTSFHPDFKMLDVPRTPASTLTRAREQAIAAGLRYVYTGNVADPRGQATYCHECGEVLIGRDGYDIGAWHVLSDGTCDECGAPVAGHFEARPEHWGTRRLPIYFEARPVH